MDLSTDAPTGQPDDSLPRRWFPDTPPLAAPAAILGIAFMIAITLASRLADALPSTAGAIVSLALLIPSTIGLPLVAWYGSRRWGTGNFADDLGFRFSPSDAPLGFVAAIALTILVTTVNIIITVLGGSNGSNLTQVSEGGRDIVTFVMLFILAGVIAPFTEEIMFRGLIQRGLSSRVAPSRAIAIQGLLFGSAHFTPGEGWGNLGLTASLAAMGMGLGWLARLTGRLGIGIVAHSLFNCAQLALLWATLK